MTSAPPGAGPRRAAFTLLELLVVIAVVAALAGLVLGVGRQASAAGKAARARAELAVLSAALESYQRTFGDFPRTDDEARLLQSLLGRVAPLGAAVSGRAHLVTVGLAVARPAATGVPADPLVAADAVVLDPWGQPYVYAYKSQAPWTNPGYVLYSIGPDGKDSAALLPGGIIDPAPPENADNICANRR